MKTYRLTIMPDTNLGHPAMPQAGGAPRSQRTLQANSPWDGTFRGLMIALLRAVASAVGDPLPLEYSNAHVPLDRMIQAFVLLAKVHQFDAIEITNIDRFRRGEPRRRLAQFLCHLRTTVGCPVVLTSDTEITRLFHSNLGFSHLLAQAEAQTQGQG